METAMSGADADVPPETPPADQGPELDTLRRQADSLAKELEAIRQRIDRLQDQPPATSAPSQG
jgi:hypothetical protein